MQLLEWWNLVFVLPFLGALFYLLLQASGLVSMEHGAQADAGLDADIDHDVDVGADLDTDVGADADADVDHDAHHGLFDHGGEDATGFVKALSFLGLGKVPLSLILMSLCFVWGFTGWASNLALQQMIPAPAVFFWISLSIAVVCSVVLTRLVVMGLSKISPATESYDVAPSGFIGRTAKAVYPITAKSGTARLTDPFGNLRDLPCRLEEGVEPVAAGASVVLMRYDSDSRAFYARPDPLGDRGISHLSDSILDRKPQ